MRIADKRRTYRLLGRPGKQRLANCDNPENTPPKIHNLPTLVLKTKLRLTEEEIDFLRDMNQFQIEGRYPDYKNLLYNTYKSEKTKIILDKVNTMRLCLLNKL